MKDTYKIADGKVKTDMEKNADELRFAVEEGYSDQDILVLAESVNSELQRLKKVL